MSPRKESSGLEVNPLDLATNNNKIIQKNRNDYSIIIVPTKKNVLEDHVTTNQNIFVEWEPAGSSSNMFTGNKKN